MGDTHTYQAPGDYEVKLSVWFPESVGPVVYGIPSTSRVITV